jgi:hypothetical protein
VKENKISIDQAKSDVSISAIQDTLRKYHGVMLEGLDTVSNTNVVNMIRLQRQKTADKKALAKDRRIGPEELKIYNQIAVRND